MRAKAFAPAKINLALHVTGQREDGYHLLDSLVMFADIGDHLEVALAPDMSLEVTGPRSAGVPRDDRNLCWRAAELAGVTARITLDKHLPAAAGIGGGSSDAAAVLRALSDLTGTTPSQAGQLGADLPVCLHASACRMEGIGEQITPMELPALPAVLVNPGVETPTPAIFKALRHKDNPPMSALPDRPGAGALIDWLATQRNDLEPPACAQQPIIDEVLAALSPARLARMSGSGATCFGLCDTEQAARELAAQIAQARPDWWVTACTLR